MLSTLCPITTFQWSELVAWLALSYSCYVCSKKKDGLFNIDESVLQWADESTTRKPLQHHGESWRGNDHRANGTFWFSDLTGYLKPFCCCFPSLDHYDHFRCPFTTFTPRFVLGSSAVFPVNQCFHAGVLLFTSSAYWICWSTPMLCRNPGSAVDMFILKSRVPIKGVLLGCGITSM